MHGKILTLFCALVLVAASTQADDKAGAGKELMKFHGVWKFKSVVRDGKEAKSVWGGQLKDLTITFADDKFTVKKDDEVVQAGTQKLDPSKSPRTVDATVTEGEGKGKVLHGIYKLDGNTLKVCFDVEGKKRPAKFEAGAGSGAILIIHVRAKK